MLINEMVADLTGDHDAFGGWLYFMSFFGSPGGSEPWGWQIDGHHLCLSVAVIEGRVVSTPAFMGSEPRSVRRGPYAPISLFDPEESLGIRLINSLDPAQRATAILHPSIGSAHLPPQLQHPIDGRMQAGAAHDNVVLPYQGIAGVDLDGDQRRVLLELADAYLSWNREDQAAPRLHDVESHLDETWFSWYGETREQSAFYYRLHSPVVLIEFDHHPGSSSTTWSPAATTCTPWSARPTAGTTAPTCCESTTQNTTTARAPTTYGTNRQARDSNPLLDAG